MFESCKSGVFFKTISFTETNVVSSVADMKVKETEVKEQVVKSRGDQV
jgi:hypothetical protein